jgi:hypothetical protein
MFSACEDAFVRFLVLAAAGRGDERPCIMAAAWHGSGRGCFQAPWRLTSGGGGRLEDSSVVVQRVEEGGLKFCRRFFLSGKGTAFVGVALREELRGFDVCLCFWLEGFERLVDV